MFKGYLLYCFLTAVSVRCVQGLRQGFNREYRAVMGRTNKFDMSILIDFLYTRPL